MTGQINVNKIAARTGASIAVDNGDALTVDTLKGTATAGSITVQGEGSATTNLQQGLMKQWAYYDHVNATIKSSFNTSSVTDVTTGSGRMNMTSAYASFNDYGAQYTGNAYNGNSWNTNTANTKMNWNTTNSGSLYDFASYSDGVSSYQDSLYAYAMSYGDLA